MAENLQHLIKERYRERTIPVNLILPDGARVQLAETPAIDVFARTWRGLKALASPALGSLARAYVHNDIDFTGSARKVLSVAEAMVGSVAQGRDSALARVRGWWQGFAHHHRGNRTNIAHHYDVSNAFYKLWLDRRMVYSCAYFQSERDSLEDAQTQKLEHICRKLQLTEGERFLDIGCGWGALILYAAQNYGVQAHGITLSQNQFEHVRRRIAELGLEGRVSVELRDYLDLEDDARYDKIASVGMFEHVGVASFPRYFGKIHALLKPGGLVLNHGITHNWVGPGSLGGGIGEFVEEYVFPGGELTHISAVIDGLARCGLEVIDGEALREHYAKTLWQWVDRLEANADAARAEVGEEKFRVWRIYMAGSAHAFERGWLSIFQLLAGKPFSDGRLPHPLTRGYMYGPTSVVKQENVPMFGTGGRT